MNPPAPSSGIQATLAQTYTFQVRAVDKAGNASGWVQTGPVEARAVTKYYLFGDQRVAMRRGNVVYYLNGDHLGSVSLTTDYSGQIVAQNRYLPYGEERWSSGASPTDFGFTSQRNEAYMELIDYGARWYDPQLGRFISSDPIIPEPQNPQSLNRYSYAYGNPLKYIDPSGHIVCGTKERPCRNPVQFKPIEMNSSGSVVVDWLHDTGLNLACGIAGGWCEVENSTIQPTDGAAFVSNGVTNAAFGMVVPLRGPGNISGVFEFANRLTEGGTSTFNPEKLEKILVALELEGVEVIRGQEAAELLDMAGAEAGYAALPGRPGILLLRDNPSVSAVVEELIHLGQHRSNGWQAFTQEQGLLNEIRAQRYLLDNAERLGLGSNEIEQIRINQDIHFQRYLDYMGW